MVFFTRRLANGSLMEIVKVYPLDAVYDSFEDVPEDVCMKCQFISLPRLYLSE